MIWLVKRSELGWLCKRSYSHSQYSCFEQVATAVVCIEWLWSFYKKFLLNKTIGTKTVYVLVLVWVGSQPLWIVVTGLHVSFWISSRSFVDLKDLYSSRKEGERDEVEWKGCFIFEQPALWRTASTKDKAETLTYNILMSVPTLHPYIVVLSPMFNSQTLHQTLSSITCTIWPVCTVTDVKLPWLDKIRLDSTS